MTADDFRRAIRGAAAQAREFGPDDTDGRARSFAAALTGRLFEDEFEMAKLIWAMVSAAPLIPEATVV